MPSQSIVYKNW